MSSKYFQGFPGAQSYHLQEINLLLFSPILRSLTDFASPTALLNASSTMLNSTGSLLLILVEMPSSISPLSKILAFRTKYIYFIILRRHTSISLYGEFCEGLFHYLLR